MTRRSNVAVFIRCHNFSLKIAHLFCELEGGVGYDLFFMTDDTKEIIDYGNRPRISFTSDNLKEFNVDPSYPMAVVHYGDLMFSIFERSEPNYEHYIMLDFDIHFSFLGRAWMEMFCHLLETNSQPIDLVAPRLGPSPPSWVWHHAAEKYFGHAFGSFFPIVAVSQRAIRYNERRRMDEAATRRPDEEPVFCESFLPSALHEAGYNLVELNTLLPGSYSLSSFDFALPAPFVPEPDCVIGRVIHPIKAMSDAPLPPDASERVRQIEPHRGYPVSPELAFAVASDMVKDQVARDGLLATARPREA